MENSVEATEWWLPQAGSIGRREFGNMMFEAGSAGYCGHEQSVCPIALDSLGNLAGRLSAGHKTVINI